MNIVNVKIKDIVPFEGNAKKHDKIQIANVAKSIKEFGFQQPLVLDKNNTIIIGHCRLAAAKKLKLKEVPCVYYENEDPAQINKLRLLDNKLNESEWDFELVSAQVPELDFEGYDIDWGIESKENFTQNSENVENTANNENTDKEQVLNNGSEISLDAFSADKFNCTCPRCGFVFNFKGEDNNV